MNGRAAFVTGASQGIGRGDDTLNLARRFEDSGVQIELKRYEGVCHAFIGLGRMVDAGNTAIANAAAFATRMFEKSKAT